MIKPNYFIGSTLTSSTAPPLPSYTSPYSGYTRYRGGDYAHASQKYSEVTPYATPINYSRISRLSRGSSLQDVGTKTSPQMSRRTERMPRQASLETDAPSMYGGPRIGYKGEAVLTPKESVYYHDLRRRYRRQESGGRGEQGGQVEKKRPVDCNKICTGIIIGNGETVCDLNYLKSAGVTHVLNTAEQHVSVSQARYAAHGIQYYGFHVDDLPHCNISRYFHRTTEFLHRAVTGGGLVVVNCYMGLSRSASVVIAYLMTKHDMSFDRALAFVKKNRAVRPNEGFVRQLRDLELSLKRRR